MNGFPDTFAPRPYPDIVRDLLTSLTHGTVRESVTVPAETGGVIELKQMANRPIRRVSHLQGVVQLANGNEIPYRFTPADFELVGPEGGGFNTIRFRPGGASPPAGSLLVINYYPVQIDPPPVTDLNVGSVARTLMEAVSVELALQEQLLDRVYRSAFLETADGDNLDKVVALVGVIRLPAGVPVARLRFERSSSSGRIVIPVGTVASDAEGKLRYATLAPLALEPGEAAREVRAAAVDARADPAPAGALNRLEVLVAGIASVTNPTDAVAAAAPESDDELRRRARAALSLAARGTVDALEFGLRAVPGVKDVAVVEEPNGIPGEIRIDMVYTEETPEVLAVVAARIQDLRPAGVRVLAGTAATQRLDLEVTLTLAGSGVADLAALQADVRGVLKKALNAIPPGGAVRRGPLMAAVLADSRILDATIAMSLDGGAAAESAQLAPGSALEVGAFAFPPAATETAAAAPAVQADVEIPIALVGTTTAAEAQSALRLAVESYLATPPAGGLSVDAMIGAVRDESRYAVRRADVVATFEAAGRFTRLTDGQGSFVLLQGQTVTLRTFAANVREGGV